MASSSSQANGEGKNRKGHILAAGEACTTIFGPSPGLTLRGESLTALAGFPAEGYVTLVLGF